MQIPILTGITADQRADYRSSMPRNMLAVPKQTGISQGYLRPGEGVVSAGTAPGLPRGAKLWNGSVYRVLGTKLCTVAQDGTVTQLGEVGGTSRASLDYSFDRLAVVSGGGLFYWSGTTLTQVTDPDIGTVIDVVFLGGYFILTDGVNLIVTDLTDPTSINPLKYGSAESDPDPVFGVDKLRNEAYAFGRYTIEVFQNIGGDNFPFQRVDGAQVTKGILGTHCRCNLGDSFAILGSGKDEAPGVYIAGSGSLQKISDREIDEILLTYTEAQLSTAALEYRADKSHRFVWVRLPDRTLCFDINGSQVVGQPVWTTLDSGSLAFSAYRAGDLVWCFNRWNVADPTSTALGYLSDDVASHFGAMIQHGFDTFMVYNAGNGGIIHELELVGLPGRAAFGADPVVWHSWSPDGRTWSAEVPKRVGAFGETEKRIQWRSLGKFLKTRVLRFRWTSDAMLAAARLEAKVEGLFTSAGAANG